MSEVPGYGDEDCQNCKIITDPDKKQWCRDMRYWTNVFKTDLQQSYPIQSYVAKLHAGIATYLGCEPGKSRICAVK